MASSLLLPQGSSYFWAREFTLFQEKFGATENESLDQWLESQWKSLVVTENLGEEEGGEKGEGFDTPEGDVGSEKDEEASEVDDDRYIEGMTVRNFMRTRITKEPEFLDQIEKVEGFCRDVSLRALESGTYPGSQEPVALLDDMENPKNDRFPGKWVSRRLYLGLLNHAKLLKQLSGKRFKVGEECLILGNQPNADRRLLYIENLDPWSVLVLAKTASRSQVSVLRRMIYGHLTARTWFNVQIPPRGFKTFSLELNISYYCLRKSATRKPIQDKRKNWEGTGPLRKSWEVPTLQADRSSTEAPQKFYNLYEAQLSVSVSGVDHWRWIAYAFVDAWFPQCKSVYEYNQESVTGARPDPLAAGMIDIDPPERNPREYFLRVFEIRIKEVKIEWDFILQTFREEIQRTKTDLHFSFSNRDFRNEEEREKIKAVDNWINGMTEQMGNLLKCLLKTRTAWGTFTKTHIGYFLHDEVPSASLTARLPSLPIIQKELLEFDSVHRELKQLKGELEDLGRMLVNCLDIENNNAAFTQQKAAEHVKLLTWVTIVWSPVIIASALCSTQDGIIPFRKNIWDFVGSLLILIVLVAMTVAMLLNWSTLIPTSNALWKDICEIMHLRLSVKQMPCQSIKIPRFNLPIPLNVRNRSITENLESYEDIQAETKMLSRQFSYLKGIWKGCDTGDPEAAMEMSTL